MNKKIYHNILIIGAMRQEVEPLLKESTVSSAALKKGSIVAGKYDGKTIRFIITGIGERNATETIRNVLREVPHSDVAFVIGICGAVDKRFKVGDIFIPESVVDSNGDVILLTSEHRNSAITEISGGNVYIGGTLMTVNKLFMHNDKRKIARFYPDARAVDMESYPVVKELSEKGIPAMVIKSVSDKLTFPFPHEHAIKKCLFTNIFPNIIPGLMLHPFELLKVCLLRRNVDRAIKCNLFYLKELLRSKR
jgi:nucleoside phosphorylase